MSLYIKKLDKSLLESGRATLDKKQLEDNEWLKSFDVGESRNIKAYFNNREYDVNLAFKSRKKNKSELPYYQLSIGEKLKKELKKTFIHTVLNIKSSTIMKQKGRKFNEEALSIELIKKDAEYVLRLKPFIRISTEYDEYFKVLIKSNLLDYPLGSDNKKVIVSSSEWLDISEIDKYKGTRNIIYYLLNSKAKEIYIGSTNLFENRVTVKKSELPDWDKFRFEVINPDYTAILRDIEYMIIRNFANVLKNNDNIKGLEINEYTLVNRRCYKIK
ncbi:hypothetical protein [Clostridium baratii]|uniref:hypothetical protein n=1 Tax=Clostridium baratii TaxID=1561 RepID=UPI0005F2D5AA|nr:hypothetical protein [Clostridium baratii]KJU71144.1 hypothetical protein UC77_11235 [Clostridium baratii]